MSDPDQSLWEEHLDVHARRLKAAIHGRMAWPLSGVYLFFELGETVVPAGAGLPAIVLGGTIRPVTRLTVELVPSTCWWSNVRSHVAPAVWERLRRATATAAGNRPLLEDDLGVGRFDPTRT